MQFNLCLLSTFDFFRIQEKYIKGEMIGVGVWGTVWRVKQVESKKTFAMKMMSSTTAEEKKMALNEIELLKTINHENIVKFEEEFHESGFILIILEYCCKGDLASVIRRQKTELKTPFPEEKVILWFKQLVSGMVYLHKNNIIHRDINLTNIFLSSSKNLKIGDFGFARKISGKPTHLVSTNITRYNTNTCHF